jgi:hypothetical protein
MADVIYRVVIDLETRGDLSGQADRSVGKFAALDGAISKLGHNAVSVAGSIAHAFESAVEKVIRLASHVAKIGTVGAFAAATWGVVSFNNEMEKSKIGLAAIFGANKVTSNMTDGLELASKVIADMKKDAAALPGEFKDLRAFVTLGMNPALQLGSGVGQFREMSAKAMAAAAAVGTPMDQAAREWAQLLRGHAGGHNVFGSQLGLTAQNFNHLQGADRLKALAAAVEKFGPAIDAYKKSFEGLSSTFKDNVKNFVGLATEPLFDKIKGTLSKANDWFDANQDKVARLADTIGTRLGAAYDVAITKIKEWYPAIKAFVDHAAKEIERIWSKVAPFAGKLEDKAKGFLSDPKSIGKIEKGLGVYGALKIGEPIVGGIGKMVGPMASLAGGLMSSGAGAGLLSTLANPYVLAAAAAAAVLLLETLVAIGGAFHAITDDGSLFHDKAVELWESIKSKVEAAFTKLEHAWTKLEPKVMVLVDLMGVNLLIALDQVATSVLLAAEGFDKLVTFMDLVGQAIAKILNISIPAHAGKAPHAASAPPLKVVEPKKTLAKPTTGAGGGGGGVTVHKVEITVTGTQDPNRIARVVEGHIANLTRFRKSSPYSPNFSASR